MNEIEQPVRRWHERERKLNCDTKSMKFCGMNIDDVDVCMDGNAKGLFCFPTTYSRHTHAHICKRERARERERESVQSKVALSKIMFSCT